MPARGFACRAARTKTAKHACESLIPPVVIQHPSLLWLYSQPLPSRSQSAYSGLIFPWVRERRTVYRMGILYRPFANEPPASCWLFIYTIVDTCITHWFHPFFLPSSFFPWFFIFFIFFLRLCVHSRTCAIFLLSNLLSCIFSSPPIHFDFNDDVVLFQSTRFFFHPLFIYLPYFFSSTRHRINFWWNIRLKYARHERFI